MSDLIPFQYEGSAVRTLLINGEPWFVLADLCKVLGIANSRNVAARLDEDMLNTVRLTDGNRGNPNVTTVSESGMYDVIVRSDSPLAKPFRRWITTEVLPSIRKTGQYGRPQELTGPELMARALLEADKTIKAIEAELATARPKAATWDALCSGKGDITITDAAKILGRAGISTGPRKLHQQMRELGWIYVNARGKWIAKQERINDGCLAERARYYIDDDGVTQLATAQVRVTAKGLDRLKKALDNPLELTAA